jgi:phosphoglycolate phosphatase
MTSPTYIFDLDGTLVDTAPDLLSATNAALESAGRMPVDPETLRHMVGFGARSLIQQAFAATGPAVTEDALPGLLEVFLDHYRANIAVGSRPFPRVPETLTVLKNEGARLGVLTNKPQDMTDLLLPRVKLDTYFSAIFGAGRRPYTKPDPRIFHDVLAAAGGVTGFGAIMIGDSITDVATARAAKVPVILVSYGYTPEPAETLGADAVTDDFAEIPGLAERLLAAQIRENARA